MALVIDWVLNIMQTAGEPYPIYSETSGTGQHGNHHPVFT